jgi:hypothetical protein
VIAAAALIGAAWAAASAGVAWAIGRAIHIADQGGPCCPLHDQEYP